MKLHQRISLPAHLLPTTVRGRLLASLWLASALGVVAAAPQDSGPAAAPHERAIEGVPQYRLFFSSHATAGVCVLGFWKLKEETTPEAVLIATVGGHMRGCGCGGGPVVWDVAKGIRDWCERHGKPFGAVDKPVLCDKPEERMSFDEFTREIDAGRPAWATRASTTPTRWARCTSSRTPPPLRTSTSRTPTTWMRLVCRSLRAAVPTTPTASWGSWATSWRTTCLRG